MRNILWISGAIFSCYLAFGPRAYAQWDAHVTGPDVFGATTVDAATTNNSGNGIVVQCNNKDTLDLAYIMPGTKYEINQLSDSESSIPETLFFKIDNGPVIKLDADLQDWNNNYVGIVASGRTPDLAKLIVAIGAANSRVSVGANVDGNKQSDMFSVGGSTDAMNKVTKDCKLGDIATESSEGAATTHSAPPSN